MRIHGLPQFDEVLRDVYYSNKTTNSKLFVFLSFPFTHRLGRGKGLKCFFSERKQPPASLMDFDEFLNHVQTWKFSFNI